MRKMHFVQKQTVPLVAPHTGYSVITVTNGSTLHVKDLKRLQSSVATTLAVDTYKANSCHRL